MLNRFIQRERERERETLGVKTARPTNASRHLLFLYAIILKQTNRPTGRLSGQKTKAKYIFKNRLLLVLTNKQASKMFLYFHFSKAYLNIELGLQFIKVLPRKQKHNLAIACRAIV